MLVNKVAQSGLIVLDLEDHFPKASVEGLDISVLLFKGLILKEREFRQALKEMDWTTYSAKHATLYCSTDAIIPHWAYMLITTYLDGIAESVHFGTPADVEEELLIKNLKHLNIEMYRDERVIIKGCGKLEKSGKAYVAITVILLPVVKSLMFGEPCSTVPVYKRK